MSTAKQRAQAVARQIKYRDTPKGREKTREINRRRGQREDRKELRKTLRIEQYARDPEYRVKEAARHAAWAATDAGKEWYALKEQRRKAAKLKVKNTLTAAEWAAIKTASKGRCYYCKKRSRRLTMDHVIPLIKGGEHTKQNIVAACQPCNSRKRDRVVTLL